LLSLAEGYNGHAVAVILSGMDHDGSVALKAVKAAPPIKMDRDGFLSTAEFSKRWMDQSIAWGLLSRPVESGKDHRRRKLVDLTAGGSLGNNRVRPERCVHMRRGSRAEGTVKIYWGGADTVMCVGEANISDLVDLCVAHGRPAK
jgi:hypothetical protein